MYVIAETLKYVDKMTRMGRETGRFYLGGDGYKWVTTVREAIKYEDQHIAMKQRMVYAGDEGIEVISLEAAEHWEKLKNNRVKYVDRK